MITLAPEKGREITRLSGRVKNLEDFKENEEKKDLILVKEVKALDKKLDQEASSLNSDIKELKENAVKTNNALSVIQRFLNAIMERMPKVSRKFHFEDVVQQLIGAWVILVPLTHFQEITDLSIGIDPQKLALHVGLTACLSFLILYHHMSEKYEEKSFLGVPLRYISLLIVSGLSTILLMFVYLEHIQEPIKQFFFLFGFSMMAAAGGDMIK